MFWSLPPSEYSEFEIQYSVILSAELPVPMENLVTLRWTRHIVLGVISTRTRQFHPSSSYCRGTSWSYLSSTGGKTRNSVGFTPAAQYAANRESGTCAKVANTARRREIDKGSEPSTDSALNIRSLRGGWNARTA
jgi:hypothetical protein